MAIQSIGVGSAANDGTGDTLRAAMQKVNDNFSFLDLPTLESADAKDGRYIVLDSTATDTLRVMTMGAGCVKVMGYNYGYDYLVGTFTMPSAAGGTGSATMTNQATTAWMPAVGQKIYIAGLGKLEITSKSGNTIGLKNNGDTGNAAAGTVAASGQVVGKLDQPPANGLVEPPGFYVFRDTPQNSATELMRLGVWDNHGGAAATPETIWQNAGRVAIIAGANGQAPSGVQMGQNAWGSGYMVMGYATPGEDDGLPITSGFSHSQWIGFPAITDGGIYSTPYIIGISHSTSADYNAGDGQGHGELWFGSACPVWSGGSYATYPGNVMMKLNRYGLTVLGGMTLERGTAVSGSTYTINFTTSKSVIDVTASASAITIATAGFKTTADAVKRTLILRAGALEPTLTFPATWAWFNDAGTGAAPTTLAQGKMMVVEIVALGTSDSAVVARYSVATDPTFSFDSDAQAYFTRATITNVTEKAAYNTFIQALKAASIYTKFDCIYFFPLETNYGYNAVSSSYDITWTGSPTHSGTLGAGVSFNGSSQYGDTGYNPSSGTKVLLKDSATVVAYCGTTTIADNSMLVAAQDGSNNRIMLSRSGSSAACNGINDAGATPNSAPASSDWSGLWIASRRSSTDKVFNLRNVTQNVISGASVGLINVNIWIGARDNGGAANFFNGNLKLVMIGSALNNTEITALQAAVADLKTALGW